MSQTRSWALQLCHCRQWRRCQSETLLRTPGMWCELGVRWTFEFLCANRSAIGLGGLARARRHAVSFRRPCGLSGQSHDPSVAQQLRRRIGVQSLRLVEGGGRVELREAGAVRDAGEVAEFIILVLDAILHRGWRGGVHVYHVRLHGALSRNTAESSHLRQSNAMHRLAFRNMTKKHSSTNGG